MSTFWPSRHSPFFACFGWIDFGPISPPNLPPKIGIKQNSPSWTSDVTGFWSIRSHILNPLKFRVWTQFGGSATSGLAPHAFFSCFLRNRFSILFGCQLPCSNSKPTKIQNKIDPKRHQNMIDFWIDAFRHVGFIFVSKFRQLAVSCAILGPKTRQLGHQKASNS